MCTRLYCAFLDCPFGKSGKSVSGDPHGQVGWGDKSGWVVHVVQSSGGSGGPGGQDDQPRCYAFRKYMVFNEIRGLTNQVIEKS